MVQTDVKELFEQAEQLNEQEKYAEVIELLDDKIVEKLNSAEIYAERGRALRELHQHQKALSDCETAINLNPFYFKAFYYRGTLYSDKELLNAEKAIADFNRVIAINPSFAFAWYKRANVWLYKTEFKKAIDDYSVAIKLNPDFARAYNNRGIAWDDLKEYDKAIDDYNKALELDPEFVLAHNNRGVALNNKKEYDKAIDQYNKTLDIDAGHVDAYINRGEAWYNKGEYVRAAEDFQKALQLDPDNYNAQSALDKIKVILGEAIEKGKKKADVSFYLFVKAVEELPAEAQRKILLKSNEIMDTVVKKIHNHAVDIDTKQVAHYTKLNVADILVSAHEPRLRYYNAVYMNDPDEGKIILDCLGDEGIRHAFENGLENADSNIYLGSFLPVERCDDLVMWRTYGKDENNIDAAGCCIVINTDFFDEHSEVLNPGMRRAVSGSPKGTAITPQSLYRVLYYDLRHGNFTGHNAKELKKDIHALKKALKELLAMKGKTDDVKKNEAIDKIVYHIISELRYFFKSSDYAYENELRVIQFAPSDSDTVLIDAAHLPKKLHINSSKPVQQQISKIILGPKVPHPEQWIYLEAAVKKKYHNHPIKLSKSECKYQ